MMNREKKYRLETVAVHAGNSTDKATGGVIQPIHVSSTYERDPDGGTSRGYLYSRLNNPNRHNLEMALCALEGGAACAAFSSGMAAVAAVLHGLAPGDHVVAPNGTYHGTADLLNGLFSRWGIATTFVDMTDLDEVRAAIRPTTRLVWIETPSNPLLRCIDIEAVAVLAHAAGARAVADNTFASPILQHPLALGCDMVVHSTTKYLAGRSDVVGGALIARHDDADFERVRHTQHYGGAVPAPFDCWLILRSLPTLPMRMRAHCANAQSVAEFLLAHPRVKAVHYPGLPGHPHHALARRQMPGGFSGMLSFEVQGGTEAAVAVATKVTLFTRATSLGGVESLIEHRPSFPNSPIRFPEGLVRLSVGLEHADDLIDDLKDALQLSA